MPQDITQIVEKFAGVLNKINGILPKHWKGNYPPDTHHFDDGTIQCEVLVDPAATVGPKAFFAFDFQDNGVSHRVECDLKVAADLSGASWECLFDGVDMGQAHVAFDPKVGLEGLTFYERMAVEITAPGLGGAEHQIRFDGDLA